MLLGDRMHSVSHEHMHAIIKPHANVVSTNLIDNLDYCHKLAPHIFASKKQETQTKIVPELVRFEKTDLCQSPFPGHNSIEGRE